MSIYETVTVACNDCGTSKALDCGGGNTTSYYAEVVEELGWHWELEDPFYHHYCHKCWLERTILGLGKRIEELQAEYSKMA